MHERTISDFLTAQRGKLPQAVATYIHLAVQMEGSKSEGQKIIQSKLHEVWTEMKQLGYTAEDVEFFFDNAAALASAILADIGFVAIPLTPQETAA